LVCWNAASRPCIVGSGEWPPELRYVVYSRQFEAPLNPRSRAATRRKEATMTKDDKKTYLWTAGLTGLIVILAIGAFALGLIPSGA